MEERLISVLYVDDESALLELGKLFLEAGGAFAVDTLTSAQEALILLETTRYDAIISDYQMPLMDGIDFLKALRTRGNTTPFIIFTGKGREEVVIQALNEGADFYLQKGGDPLPQFTELEHKIKTAVQKQRSDKTILHFNRLYAVLSGVNTTIVRAKSREELFAEICRITVEKGEFTMTWIGLIDAAHRTIEPRAHYGFDDGYLQRIQISIDDNPLGQSPSGRAVRERQHVIYNEILHEPRMEPWYPEIRKRGYLSTGAFPLFIHNTIVGILQLYSLEENFFSEGEVRLLDEVASDISFALERLEDEEHRFRTELSLKESEEKLAAVVAGSPVPKFVIDRDHRILYWNRALELATGIRAAEVIGTSEQWRAFYEEERPTMADLILDGAMDRINELYAGKIVDSPTIAGGIDVIDFFPRMGDNGRWLRFMAARIRSETGSILGAIETLVDITATKRAEEELRRSCETIAAAKEELRQQFDEIAEKEVRLQVSEERYRRFIETSDEGIWSMDGDFRTTFVNERMAKMLGYSRQEMIGRPISSFMHPSDLTDNTRQLADRKNGLSGRYERQFVRKDGTIIHALVSATPLLDEGVFAGSFAMITDISDRIRAENELRATIREYQDLLENISDVYYRSDAGGNLILASRSWAVLLGYTDLTECIGKNIAQTFYADPQVRLVFLEKVYRDGSVTDYEVVLKRKDGSLVTVATSSYLYFDETGHILGVEGTFRDITDRKRITDRLREAEQQLSDIINFLPDATFAIDREGTVIAWNHAIEEMTGVPAGDIIGRGNYEYAIPFYGEKRPILIDLVQKEDSDLTRNYSSVQRQGNVLTAETGLAHVGGKDLMLWGKASPLYNSFGTVSGAIESIRDFTERRLLEDSLKQVNRKLNLLSAITRHDILNNIMVCRGYLAMAKRKSPEPGLQENLDLIESIIGTIHSQITFTRIYQDLGASAPVWQDLGVLLHTCLDSQDTPVISEVSGIELYTDPLIGKVFTNFLDNTIRHGEHATGIHVRAEHHNNDVVIIWEDDGIGISPGEKEMIFDRGFGKNTGLGLFLAREILGITGISIRETGEFGKGARFEITVPKGIWRSVATGE